MNREILDKNIELKKDKYLWHVLKKMCKFVNVSISAVDFNKDDWFKTCKWSQTTEEQFKKWLVDYLYTNNIARKNIMAYPRKNKKHLQKFAEMFSFQFGWSYK